MSLAEFYDEHNIDERCVGFKKILIVLPEKGYEYEKVLRGLWLTKYECHFTYPKITEDELLDEIKLVECNLVIQVGKKFSKRYPYVVEDERTSNLKEKIDKALGDYFVNLHHHDEYSMRDGLGKVEDLVDIIKERDGCFCCVTNHGSLGGWVRQYNACNKEGIKPIFGMEAYYQVEREHKNRDSYHLLLLAKTQEGYENLIKIHNEAQLNGFYYSPRTCFEKIKEWGSGIVATSGCYGSEIPQLLVNDKWDEAKKAVERYREAFDDFYIELTMIEMKEQVEVNEKLVKLSNEMSIPVLLTLDSHYLKKEHCETHDLLMLIRDRKTVNDAKEKPEEVWQFSVKNLYYKNGEEVFSTFRDGFHDKDGNFFKYESEVFNEGVFWEGYNNTRGLALEVGDIKIENEAHLPKVYDNSEDIIKLKSEEGFDKLGLKGKKYGSRLRRELDVICKLGFDSYFLIVADIIEQVVKEHGEFSIGMGRGSAAGSLVAYCLNITGVDPIKYGLLFERFLDYDEDENGKFIPHAYPDIDLDFKPDVREWVKSYIVNKYKGENTCSIGTYQTYKTRGTLIDVAKALGYDAYEIMNITTQLGDLNFDAESDAIDDLPFETIMKHDKKLNDYINKRPDVLRHAKILRNQIKSMGKHAGGMIISDMNLQDRIPVVQNKEAIVSSWSESGTNQELSSVGLVKFDILGLNNLKIIQDCLDFIKSNKGKDLKKSDIPIDDKESIKKSSKADLVGIFQFENPTTKPIADKVKMDSLNDISAVTSLIRPGPRAMGMHLAYANRKNGKEEFSYLPGCEEFLKETYGVVCIEGDTRILLSNGNSKPIKEIINGDKVVSLNLETLKTEIDECHGCKKTSENKGLTFELSNRYRFTVTKNHKVLTLDGYKYAKDIDIENDLITVPNHTVFEGKNNDIANWLGSDIDIAYLLGMITGDGCKGSSISICCGLKSNVDKLKIWVEDKFPILRCRVYFNTRAYYLSLSSDLLLNDKRYGNRKKKFNHFINGMGLNTHCNSKRIPECIMSTNDMDVKLSYIAGLTDSDGCIRENIYHITSISEGLIYDICSLLKQFSASHQISMKGQRVVIYDGKFVEKMKKFLLLKSVGNFKYTGKYSGFYSKTKIKEKIKSKGISVRSFSKENGIENYSQNLYKRNDFCSYNTAVMFGIDMGDVKYYKIKTIKKVKDKVFYDMSVGKNHNLIGNGVVLSNCYQEQIMLVSQKFANFTPHESTKLRKILTKSSDKEALKGMKDKFIEGAKFRIEAGEVSLDDVKYVFDQLASFASYGFCKSHAVAYSAITSTEFWLKHNFKIEYMVALLSNTASSKKMGDDSLISKYVNYCRKNDIVVMPPNINKSKGNFTIEDDAVRMSLSCVKKFGSMAELVTNFQPFKDIEDFYNKIDKRKLNKGKVYSLICAGAFQDFGDKNEVVEEYNKLRKGTKKDALETHTKEEWIVLEKEVLSDISFTENVIRNDYFTFVRKKDWNFIDKIDKKKVCLVFGKITSIVSKKSKAGKLMYFCKLEDGMDSINFYVFTNLMKEFRKSFKVGYIVALCMDKFEDGNVRFYSARKKSIIVDKGVKK